ncbi:RidA family protein [Geodermatophilus sabuli]|uniref:Endoribonuclease L-PSP n=1 Tax=Geodermatophilus sabuli TaxID=1564158 RepID=A0A285E9C3_9ACTN|nr:RidA family protein [Geodermatophilus sabuli]MBB3082326.1 enamine deaminase RidA (YjgF/YER057c/UK114 family) [Geodermatophilus sabuli]SNX94804.1 endoribonuclease L-PSP [Geodermatophilus sabuli]
MRQEIRAERLHPPIGHYTDAVRFGDLLFLSGCGPTNEQLEVVGGDDAGAQARQVYANVATVLEAAGAGPQDVLSVTTYLTDVADAAAVDAAKREFFGEIRTASATVVAAELVVPGARVEVQAVAGVPSGR